jgi:hypothetical protein
MKHLRPRREERDPLQNLAPVGTKDCEMKCERDVIMTKTGPVVICHACERIVMDNRNDG